MFFKEKKMSFPDFLGIGAPRAATTWLYNVLSTHPDIWLPPIKELHYFDVKDPCVDRSSFRKKHILSRLKQNIAFATKPIWAEFYPDYASKIKIDISFDLKYFFGEANDRWYGSLFCSASSKNKFAGEITPSYCLLSKRYIQTIIENNKNLKFIFLIRDPIDRSWSHAVKVLCRDKGKKISDVNEGEFIDYLQSREVINCSNYISTINNYLSCIEKRKLFISKFDDIANLPVKTLNEICNFLGVNFYNDWAFNLNNLVKPANTASIGIQIPAKFEKLLAEIHIKNLEKLNIFLQGQVSDWLARAERAIDKPLT